MRCGGDFFPLFMKIEDSALRHEYTFLHVSLTNKHLKETLQMFQKFMVLKSVTFSISASWKGKRLVTNLYSSSVSTGMGL